MLLEGLTHEMYLEKPGLSRSDLVLFRRGPNHYKYFSGQKKSKAFSFGTLLHQAILEPDRELQYTAKPNGLNLSTKEGKAWKAKASGEIITEQEALDLKLMTAAFNAHPVASQYVKGSINEATIEFDINGVKCKARPDIIQGDTVIDIKTTRHLNPRQMNYDYKDRGYDLQAGFYTLAAQSVLEKPITNFVLVYILKNPPYEIMVKYVPSEEITRSQMEIVGLVEEFKQCAEQDRWESRIPVEPTPMTASFVEMEIPEVENEY
jgi:hypothetical protein